MCNNQAIISTAISGIMGILGAFIGFLLSRSNSREIIRISQFNQAVGQFRAAFFKAEYDLAIGEKSTSEIFNENLFDHGKATHIFRSFIAENNRINLDNAWEEYMGRKDEYGDTGYEKMKNEKRELLKERIHKLLQFAENK